MPSGVHSSRRGRPIGYRVSQETRNKLILAKSNMSDETKRRISVAKKGKPLSALHKEHSRKSWFKPGENNVRWKGGITPTKLRIRNQKKYRKWRDDVLYRDGYTCVWCGTEGERLEADHIIPFYKILEQISFEHGIANLFEESMKSDILFNINNGRTLCRECHKKTDSYGPPKRQK